MISSLAKLVFLVYVVGGCFSFVLGRKKKNKAKGCSCGSSRDSTTVKVSIDSIDSMSVDEPTTWTPPPKHKRVRTISSMSKASNFSGTSNVSNLSERDQMWLQAFRYAGR